MWGVAELVMGVLDEFVGGETITRYNVTEYSTKFSVPCNAPRSVPGAEYFWSVQTSSFNSSDFTPIELDSRRQVDQQGEPAQPFVKV